MQIREGYMPYLGYQTYYRIVGKKSNNKKPLVLLHGGPGSTHNYFELLDDIAVDGRQIIMYDQLGCGKSAVPSNPSLWKKETWANELIELRKYLGLDEIHLLGQSWGGMLAFIYMCDYQPAGIKSLILSGTLPSAKLCTPLVAKTMYDGIPNSRWELFAHSRHMPFVEENEKYESILTKWMDDHD
ncbi:alpha/beta fold hydrolase [Companilactobacillus sp.]|uniref:alpha/beta fold hydrolase n=1 Tax=Companilactobacillus sp. TaxID=2767905 RepID=UPI002607900C|nr:alpha/beta fold hydrolase [Companilactobacillus sp.]